MLSRAQRDAELSNIQAEGRRRELTAVRVGRPPENRRQSMDWRKVLADPQATAEKSRTPRRGDDISL